MGWLQSGSEGMKDIKLQKLISPTHRSRPRRADGILHGRIRFNEHSGFSREAWGQKNKLDHGLEDGCGSSARVQRVRPCDLP